MSVSLVERFFAFFDNVWSFILTLVRSLLALFSFRRRSSDPLSLPTVNRTPKDALARAHSRLRPILLTPRSITRSPAYYTQRTRSRSVTSTLFPGHSENATPAGSVPQPSGPQRTSPKLDLNDPDLALSATASIAGDHPGPPSTSATSSRGGTPDTSLPTIHTASLSVLPLTPPDRCYLAPIPSVTDCPYTESWPTNATLDRGKPRLPGSPLKVSINTEPAFAESMVGPMASPLPGRWSPPVQIWTSTPCKNDNLVPDLALSPFDHRTPSIVDPSSALANISHALISRSQSSIQPYDDASNSSAFSDVSPSVNYLPVAGTFQQPERHPTHAQLPRPKNQPYPQFHYPDAYACAWRRHGARLPGKPNRAMRTHAYAHSHSHMDLPVSEWYDADAYAPSPVSALSPPLCESATEDEDEDEMPLGRLRERLARRSAAVGATIGLGVPVGADIRMAAAFKSPRTRRMSEGCLLAISELTPTRVGVGARSGRNVLSMALDGDGYSPKDWLDALSLRFSSEQKDAPASVPEPCMTVPSIDGVTG
ncbi:hypothetical protein J3R83DRAFT_12390 [Lanmaoa asiatica]|nr:hypothetical protein J3R83DRAFT_12390 [Lanmaoa asiatica]